MNLPPYKTSDSPSKQFTLEWFKNPTYFIATYRNLKEVQPPEYMTHLHLAGDWMTEANSGKLVADFSQLSNYSISLRATAVNNLGVTVLKKIPYLVIAIVKSKSVFDTFATQAALNTARPLYKKILDGKMFDTREEAVAWLTAFQIPQEFVK
jgi:hypothetical protein